MNIKITIDRFEGEKAVLQTEDGQSIVWPKDKLPQDAREGMALNFNILSDAETEKDKRELAKEILNEILNTDN
jgi:hypothetical protein